MVRIEGFGRDRLLRACKLITNIYNLLPKYMGNILRVNYLIIFRLNIVLCGLFKYGVGILFSLRVSFRERVESI